MKQFLKNTIFYKIYVSRKFKRQREEEIENNHKVRGPLMKKYLPQGGIGAELGVLKGAFSPILLKHTNPKELHLIDPWYFLDAEWKWAGGNTSTVDAICLILQENKGHINNKKVFVHVEDDIKVLQHFPNQYFDWVYIDSSHAYDHTVEELQLIQDKVKSNGIICGDDWRPDQSHRHHGVYKAVQEFMKKENYELIYANEDNLQWFIKRNGINNEHP